MNRSCQFIWYWFPSDPHLSEVAVRNELEGTSILADLKEKRLAVQDEGGLPIAAIHGEGDERLHWLVITSPDAMPGAPSMTVTPVSRTATTRPSGCACQPPSK